MQKTKKERQTNELPQYTKGEERLNFLSHAAGAALSVPAMLFCLIRAQGGPAVICAAVYGLSLFALYTVSALYHGLPRESTAAKCKARIADHCTIYFLIAGTYTPVTLIALRRVSAGWGIGIFVTVWILCLIAAVFTAIDLKRFAAISMTAYVGAGWCIILAARHVIEAIGNTGWTFLLLGGIFYTVGAVLYGIGKRRKWFHAIFHFFVMAGSALQFVAVCFYVL